MLFGFWGCMELTLKFKIKIYFNSIFFFGYIYFNSLNKYYSIYRSIVIKVCILIFLI